MSFLVLACAACLGAGGGDAPASAPAGLQNALAALNAGDYAAAEEIALALATREDKPAGRAWLVVAAARQHRRQYAAAVRAYRMFLTACDSESLRQYAAEQIRMCQEAAATPPAVTPVGKGLTAAQRLELAVVEEQIFTESSEHFVVSARNRKLARLLAEEAEKTLTRICRDIMAGQAFPHSVNINVWVDKRDYRAHNPDMPEWSGGGFSVVRRDGLAVRRIDVEQLDEQGNFAVQTLDRVLPHEMCHMVIREYFGEAACPLFLSEGLAMLAESEFDNERLMLAGTALAGKQKVGLSDLLVLDRHTLGEPSIFYAESLSLVCFLHGRLTDGQFAAFMEHVKNGSTVAEALQRALHMPEEDRFMGQLASAWEDQTICHAQYLRALRGQSDLPQDGE